MTCIFLFLSPMLVSLFEKIQISFSNLFPICHKSPQFKALVWIWIFKLIFKRSIFDYSKSSFEFILVWPQYKFGLKILKTFDFELKAFIPICKTVLKPKISCQPKFLKQPGWFFFWFPPEVGPARGIAAQRGHSWGCPPPPARPSCRCSSRHHGAVHRRLPLASSWNEVSLVLPHCNITHSHYSQILVFYSTSSCIILKVSKAIKLGSSWNSNSHPSYYFSNQTNKCMCGNFKSNHPIRSI
jgi:hypothetical protein